MSTIALEITSITAAIGRDEITIRDGQACQAGRRRRRHQERGHDGPRDGPGPPRGAGGRGLLPAHRRRRGADVRGRQDPRRLLQARGSPDREGDPDRADDRPPDPAAVAEGLPERGAGHLHHALGRPDHPARHPRDQRRLGGADDLAAPLPGPRGRRADRDHRRRDGRQSVAPRHRRVRARPDRRRHEGRPDDGRGRRERGRRGHAPRGVRARPRRDQEALRGPGGAQEPGGQAQVARSRADGRARRQARRPHLREHRLPRGSVRPPRSRSTSLEELGADALP